MPLFVVAQSGGFPFHRLARAILPWLIAPSAVHFMTCPIPVPVTGLSSLMGR